MTGILFQGHIRPSKRPQDVAALDADMLAAEVKKARGNGGR